VNPNAQTPQAAPPGHLPTLIACFAHFDLCFMLWVLIGALSAFIFDGTGVDAALKGLLVGSPILTGSLLRVPLGILSDRIGGKRMGLGLLLFLTLPLSLAWLAATSFSALLAVSLMLGTAGSSFAIVLPLASRWYPRERQGLVMGIAAAGNSGTVIANVFAPRIATAMGWHAVFGLALIPLAIVIALFAVMAREAPAQAARTRAGYVATLVHADTWWFCVFYAITFGGYAGLSSYLPVFLKDQYAMAPVAAGSLTAAAALAGSLSRPLGGYVADRIGGVRVLQWLLCGIAASYALLAIAPSLAIVAPVAILGMMCLGLGNGVVFQLVPLRFSREIGAVTGIVGAVGGVGGFLLPTLMGAIKSATGGYSPAFLILAACATGAAILLVNLQGETRRNSWRLKAQDARLTA
jgi:NNP family nitrate/nitrite transporter-like MFS transporter